VLKFRLSKLDQKPSNLEELKEKIHEIWNSIEPEICNRVVSAIPKKLGQIIKKKAGT